jgi:hypothetical protein
VTTCPTSSPALPPLHELDQYHTSWTSITWAQLNSHLTSLTAITIAHALQPSHEHNELDIHHMCLTSWTAIARAHRAQQSSHQIDKLVPLHKLTAITWAWWAWQPSHELYKLDSHCTRLTAMKELHKLDSHRTSYASSTAIVWVWQAQQPTHKLNKLDSHCISTFVAQAWPLLHKLDSHRKSSTASTGAQLLLLKHNRPSQPLHKFHI